MEKQDPYFTPIDDGAPFDTPDTIEGELTQTQHDNGYKFVSDEQTQKLFPKKLLIGAASLIIFILFWQVYSTLIDILEHSNTLALLFSLVVLVVLGLVAKEAYLFRKSLKQYAKIERLRALADSYVKERSHGKSQAFIDDIFQLYKGKPQHAYLQKAVDELPDYLNDAEVMTRLSADFLRQLDVEAQRMVVQESIKAGSMIAVSQLPLIDSLIVIWKTMGMVNKINTIYGLSLTKIGQWQLFINIVKATLLAAGTQIGIHAVVDKTTTGMASSLAGSVSQGIGIGSYVARIGVEAMKQSRPIIFEADEVPKINLIFDSIVMAFDRVKK